MAQRPEFGRNIRTCGWSPALSIRAWHRVLTGACRRLAARPRADFIWLLDSDVGLEPSSLRPLIAAMQRDSSLGIVGFRDL